MAYKADEEIEAPVREFLKRLGLEYQPRPDLLTVIIKIKHINPAFNYARVPDHELPDAEAQWDSDKFVLRMRESIFVGMQRGETRARSTVAHELSHYLHQHEGLLNRKPGAITSEMIGNRLRSQEAEARRTAAVILAPEHLIPEGATAADIVAMFGLSPEAAIYRQQEIEGIRRRRRGEGRKIPQSIIDFLREAKRRGHPVQTRLDD